MTKSIVPENSFGHVDDDRVPNLISDFVTNNKN